MSFNRSLSILPRFSPLSQLSSYSIHSTVMRPLTCAVGNKNLLCHKGSMSQLLQRNFSAINVNKDVRDDPTTSNASNASNASNPNNPNNPNNPSNQNKETASGSSEVPVQSGQHDSNESMSGEGMPSRRSRRDWMMDEFDSMFAPFRSFVPRQFRHPFKQMQRWMNREARALATEPEEQLANSVRDMIYDFDAELLKPVSLTLEEKQHEYLAKIYLKGFQKSDLNLRLQDDYLIVNGSLTNEEFKDRKDRGKMHTYSSQSFSRVLNLPDDVDRTKIHAKFENNELLIQLPKDSKKKHVIEIH